MSPKFRTTSCFAALATLLWVSTAWAGDAAVQADAARAMQRGERLVQEGHFREAATEFERASDLTGGPCPDCLLGVGRAYSGARQYDAALQVTRMALALFSSPQDQARAYDQIGTLLALKGEMPAAREAYGKAVQLDGRMAGQVRSSLAGALLKRASYDRAKDNAQGPVATAIQEVAVTAGIPQR